MSTDDTARPGRGGPSPRGRVRADLRSFAVLLFVVSWIPLALAAALGRGANHGIWFLVGTSGPTLVAIGLWLAGRRLERRPRANRSVLRAVVRPVVWVVAALVLGAVPPLVAALVASGLDARPIDLGQARHLIDGAGGPALAVVSFLAAGPLAEELGWRGFVQPRLRRLLAPVATSVVLGVGWAVWHVPLFFVGGTTQSTYGLVSLPGLLYLLGFLPLSYLAWLVSERLGGGVTAAVLLHVAGNATAALLRSDPLVTTAVSTCTAAVLAVAAHLLIRPAARPLPSTPDDRGRQRVVIMAGR